jgi:hypothetical protein
MLWLVGQTSGLVVSCLTIVDQAQAKSTGGQKKLLTPAITSVIIDVQLRL